jgi:hypothetical protein
VRLAAVDEDTLGEAVTLAWRNAVDKGAHRPSTRNRSARPARRSTTH